MGKTRNQQAAEHVKRLYDSLASRKIELFGYKIDKDILHDLWGTGAPVLVKGKKYAVHKMSYGDYFLEPFGYIGSETSDFHSDTLWLQKIPGERFYVLE
jgi:hypothetical protein